MFGLPKTSCSIVGCNMFASFICKCSSSPLYCCAKHIEKHRVQSAFKGEHPISFTSSSLLQGQEKAQTLNKLNNLDKILKKCKKQALTACEQVITALNSNLKSMLSQIKGEINNVLNFKRHILKDQQINSDILSALDRKVMYKFNTEYIKGKISEMFTFDYSKNNLIPMEDKMLFANDNAIGYVIIDLKTLKFNSVVNSSKYWRYSAACAISNEEYFINGGCSSLLSSKRIYYGNTSIINLKSNNEEVFLSNSPKAGHSCVFKNGNVYSFGGYDGSNLNSAEMFNLKTKLWNFLPTIPVESYTTSSGLIENTIIITGFNLDYVYVFNENTYVKNLSLPVNNYFWVCGKWIIGSNNKLYECRNLETALWDKCALNISGIYGWLPINATYQRDNFIYILIQTGSKLWRIDIVSKSATCLN